MVKRTDRAIKRWHLNILKRDIKSGYADRMRKKGVEPYTKGSPLRPAYDSMVAKKRRAKQTKAKRRAKRRKTKKRKK